MKTKAEQTVVLYNVSWETYQRLLEEQQNSHSVRLDYDQGTLEIMILSLKHEKLRHIFSTLVELLASELNIDIEGAGSTTFRREDLARGFEPDASFYIQHAALIRSKEEIDLATDPAPELVIEIDITHSSLNKLAMFASLGVLEVWRYDGKILTIHRLTEGNYVTQAESVLLPGITAAGLTKLVMLSQSLKRSEWLQQVQKINKPTE